MTRTQDGAPPGPAPTEHPVDGAVTHHIESALAEYLGRRTADAAGIDPAFAEATDVLGKFVLGGGKRVRPTFAWWGWRGAGGDPGGPLGQAVLRAISALELVQAWALVHDDLIDASPLRRGRPAVHVAFARQHAAGGWAGPPARFGASAALLLGDLALVWADDLLQDAGLPAEALQRALRPWRAMRTELIGGQSLDVLGDARADSSTAATMRVNRFKTAAYTVERPLHLGAAIADAPASLIRAYRRFGIDLGIAYQLRDDLLGVFGDPLVTGKPAGEDIREGKRTLLVAVALQQAEQRGDAASYAELLRALGDATLEDRVLDRVRDILVELGAVRVVEQHITRLTGSALDALTASGAAEPGATRLAELATAVMHRNS